MPLLETRGAASAKGFGLTASTTAATYVEDVFSTYLYTGNGSARSITNEIDLSTKGGLVWIKDRTSGWANQHQLVDTARGATNSISSDSTGNQAAYTQGLTAFLSNGFSLGTNGNYNLNGNIYASWTFREQSKFFDVVTYTGTGSPQNISHNLGSVPGFIIVKRYDGGSEAWNCYHRSLGNNSLIYLNYTDGAFTPNTNWNNTTPTSTVFTVSGNSSVNQSGASFVAYLFAHDAGGFGLTGTDNVISCGSFTTDGSGNATVSLGYEPQWVLYKRSDSSTGGSWHILDSMRGLTVTTDAQLLANTSDAETTGVSRIAPSATGFYNDTSGLVSNATYIYIAIRRGPMRTPTTGTSVFSPVANTGNNAEATITSNFPVDLAFRTTRNVGIGKSEWDRLRGAALLETNTTAAESSNSSITFDSNTAVKVSAGFNGAFNYITWMFQRAPGFFDVVCYTGNGAQTARNHNLGVVPELILLKRRSGTGDWDVSTSFGASTYSRSALPYTNAFTTLSYGTGVTYGAAPTATTFTTSQDAGYNASGATFVAYLFASCPGVSKVGSYTGTGTTQQINCGFTGGARFVLIKRTDSTGDWYCWDSSRGIVSGNDPYLLLNSTAAEVTNTDYIDTYSAGFEISSTAPAAINANGGSFVFLAIS